MSTFDFMKPFSMFATLPAAIGGSNCFSLGLMQEEIRI